MIIMVNKVSVYIRNMLRGMCNFCVLAEILEHFSINVINTWQEMPTLKIIIQRLDIQNELYKKWYSSNIFNPSEALILEYSAITHFITTTGIN